MMQVVEIIVVTRSKPHATQSGIPEKLCTLVVCIAYYRPLTRA